MKKRVARAIGASLLIAAESVIAADLEYCAPRPVYLAAYEDTAEASLPAIELSSAIRASVTAAQERMNSEQAALERSQQKSREKREAESVSESYAYTISVEDSRALSATVAAQPKTRAPASDDLIAQAAKLGVEAAATETNRLLATGAAPTAARRGGQERGAALAKAALTSAGATLSRADEQRLTKRIGTDIDAGTAPAGVAPWALSTTRRVQSSRAREQSTRAESSTSVSMSEQARLSSSAQSQMSEGEQRAQERALSVPIRVDWNRDIFVVWYSNKTATGIKGDGVPFRVASVTCRNQAEVMAYAAYQGLRWVAPRDSEVADEVTRAYEIARTGNLWMFAAAVTSLADDPRLAAKGTALMIIHQLGSSTAPWRRNAVSPTLLQQHTLDAIRRQFEVVAALEQQQRALSNQPFGTSIPDAMPSLVGAPGRGTMPMSPSESMLYQSRPYFTIVQLMRNAGAPQW